MDVFLSFDQPLSAGGQAERQQPGCGHAGGTRRRAGGTAGQQCPQSAAASSALAGPPEPPGVDRQALAIPAGTLPRPLQPQLSNSCGGSTERAGAQRHPDVLVWPTAGAGGSVGRRSLVGREQLVPETSKTSQAWILKNSEHDC